MAATSTNRFGPAVRQRLLDNKIAGRKPDSIRGLARAMGANDPVRSETYKRSLFKWMADGEPRPTRESRALVAHHLGLDPSELADDDEESDPVADLMAAIRRVVRAEMQAAGAA